jgi:hypothetical protein
MPTFPATLAAKIQRNGYEETPPDLSMRSGMDTGPDKVRRRQSAGARPITFPMFLDDDDVADLDTFYVTTTQSGSLEFDFTSPRTGVTYSVRFLQPPTFRANDLHWNVTVALEIMP